MTITVVAAINLFPSRARLRRLQRGERRRIVSVVTP
jgi:hypothetical protein